MKVFHKNDFVMVNNGVNLQNKMVDFRSVSIVCRCLR